MRKSGYKILIVDDENTVKHLLAELLSSEGHKCETASDGVEAIDKVAAGKFDAVVTDIAMPEMDGITLTMELSKSYPDLPIMVMTAFTNEYSAKEAVEAGASDFIGKPFSPEEFLLRFHKMMSVNEIIFLSKTDHLTGVFNRKKFVDELRREIERTVRYGQKLSIVMFDIDRFKDVNDNYGHQVGDYVLKEIARVTERNIRKIDIFARYGGEEFIILMPSTDIEGARNLAEKLRMKIEAHKFGHLGRITCSFGVSEYALNEDEENFIRRADVALYAAKNRGRNRVEILAPETV